MRYWYHFLCIVRDRLYWDGSRSSSLDQKACRWLATWNGLGAVRWCYAHVLVRSQIGLPLSALAESTPLSVNKVVWYVVGRLDNFICFTVAAPSHHMPKVRFRADMLDNSVHYIKVFGIPVCLLLVPVGVWLSSVEPLLCRSGSWQ